MSHATSLWLSPANSSSWDPPSSVYWVAWSCACLKHDKTIVGFSPQTASKMPSNTMKASQQGRTLKVRTCISPYPVIKMYDVFRNKVLLTIKFQLVTKSRGKAYSIHSPSLPKVLFSVSIPTHVCMHALIQTSLYSGMDQDPSPSLWASAYTQCWAQDGLFPSLLTEILLLQSPSHKM